MSKVFSIQIEPRPPKKQVNLIVPEPLHTAFKQYAEKQGYKMTHLLIVAMESFLKSDKKENRKSARS